jgi:hypothetical protein
MANFLNWQDPPTTGAPMSTLIPYSFVKAEPVEGALGKGAGSAAPPTTGQLFPRGLPR